MNFLDQQTTKDGKPFGPIRYKQIAKECYLITKNTSTSYNEVLGLTPTDRQYLIEFLVEEAKEQEEMWKKKKAEREANRKNKY